jgi:hypothetical protein
MRWAMAAQLWSCLAVWQAPLLALAVTAAIRQWDQAGAHVPVASWPCSDTRPLKLHIAHDGILLAVRFV